MNVPAIAQRTFEESRNNPDLIAIVNLTLEALAKLSTPEERVKFLHAAIDDLNVSVFTHPLVKQFSPCKMGCSGCCHTQVSVTEDEARVLASKITEGIAIDFDRVKLQSETRNDAEEFFKLKYADRKCVFLDENGACSVYEDRPSVCRTNAVLGTADQCDTSVERKPVRLVKTPQADMVIYAQFLFSNKNGSLHNLVSELIMDKES